MARFLRRNVRYTVELVIIGFLAYALYQSNMAFWKLVAWLGGVI